jgi:hypothetical protein
MPAQASAARVNTDAHTSYVTQMVAMRAVAFAGDIAGMPVHLKTRSKDGLLRQHTVYRERRKDVEAKSLLWECCRTVAASLREHEDPPWEDPASAGFIDYSSVRVAPLSQLISSIFALMMQDDITHACTTVIIHSRRQSARS